MAFQTMAGRAGRSQTISLSSRLGAKTDPKSKFGGDGMNFKVRFVGSEEVMEGSGNKIAQAAIGRIRAACREAGGAKPKVLINLSFSGIKVADLKTKVWSINVPVPRLTYVTKDAEDRCVFCIIVARKKAGFKLFVYKAEERITAQIVQSIRELFQVVYKMVQQKKKMEETKSKSATTLPKSTSDVAIARITSDSKLLDAPPQYEENLDPNYSMVDFPPPPSSQGTVKSQPQEVDEKADPGYSMVDFPPPPSNQAKGTAEAKPQEDDNLVDLSSNPLPPPPTQQDTDIYAVPFTKRKSSSAILPHGYQIPTSNKPAPPIGHYQVPSNRPAYADTTDATKEWSVLDAELAEIAKDLNMFGSNISSTPEQPAQQPRRLSTKQPSIVDPFQDVFFEQPFNPLEGELNSSNLPDDSITFESSDPFSSPDLSALSDNINGSDDPFTAFEFNSPTNNKPTDNNPGTTAVQQPLVETEVPPSVPPDPYGVRVSLDQPPNETEQSKISSGNHFDISASLGATTSKKTSQNWATFESDRLATGLTDTDKAKKRSSMFEESFSSKESIDRRSSDVSKDQTVSPLKPPPRSRRRSSRPHTVYGDQGIKANSQPQQQPTTSKPLFDFSSVKPKTKTEDNDTSDPFMDLFMRKPDDELANMLSTTNGVEYASTHL